MKTVLFVVVVAVMGSTAMVIRNDVAVKRVSRQAIFDNRPTEDCICVIYNQCNTNYTLNKYGVTIIDIRRISPCKTLEVCCKKEDRVQRVGRTPQDLSTNSLTETPPPPTSNDVSPTSLASTSSIPSSSPLTSDPSSSPSTNDALEDRSPSTDIAPTTSLSTSQSITEPTPSSSSSTDSDTPPSSISTESTLSSSTPTEEDAPSNIPSTDASPSSSSSDTDLSTTPPSTDPAPSSSSTTDSSSSSSQPTSTPPLNLPEPSSSSSPASTPSSSSISPSTDNPPTKEDPDSVRIPPKTVTVDQYQSRGCGFRNTNGVGFRIIGGETEAQFGEFPWVVALLTTDGKFICGASLIHPKVVMTGAHCVRGIFKDKIVARAGEWDRAMTDEIIPYQERKILEVIEHDDFYKDALLNDIALLILEDPMDLADNVETICLPPQDYNFDHSKCVASGWGKENFNSKKGQVILKKVDLPIVPSDTCESALRKTRLGNYFELHDSFICAGGNVGQDTCTGDGGSPLMCPLKDDSQRYEQAGIVAWGIGCGGANPGVYASVSRFRNWIDSELRERGITLPKP